MVRAIRGAITVEANTPEDIISSTKELLIEIMERNDLKLDEIISIIFTTTSDLNAGFPAAAARELGWKYVPLLCAREIDVPGSLKKCVRVLMHVNTQKSQEEINHVYLKGAKCLRTDLSED